MTEYYYAKEREESAVERINDSYLEALNSLEKLEAEDAKLREERDTYRDSVDCMVHPDIPDQLAADNAKLRELVRFIMHQCNDGNPRCDECIGWNGGECVALQRMRELGVEADG